MIGRHLRMTNIISKTLQLKDQNIIFSLDMVEEKVHRGLKSLFYFAKLTYEPLPCPECGIKKCGANFRDRILLTTRLYIPADKK